jgi:hypothetical protein
LRNIRISRKEGTELKHLHSVVQRLLVNWAVLIIMITLTGTGFAELNEMTPGQVPCVPPPPNMVAWWPGDGNANDVVGLNSGTLIGGVTFPQGRVGQAFT